MFNPFLLITTIIFFIFLKQNTKIKHIFDRIRDVHVIIKKPNQF